MRIVGGEISECGKSAGRVTERGGREKRVHNEGKGGRVRGWRREWEEMWESYRQQSR